MCRFRHSNRFLQSELKDIEDLAPGTGGVLNPTLKAPLAVYKDDVHGSRFFKDGVCVMGSSKAGLSPVDEDGRAFQAEAIKA